MNRLLSFCLLVLLGGFSLACESASDTPQDPNRAAFVTVLGNDTLAVEQFVRTPARMEAEVLLRTPQTTLQRYTLDLDADGGLLRFEGTVQEPGAASGADPMRRTVVTLDGDSLVVKTTREGETEVNRVAGDASVLPFLDMIHWPFELMLTRAYAAPGDSATQMLLSGRRVMPFVVRQTSDRTMTVQHPFRGTMDVEVDGEGRLVGLDAGATTRKLKVKRVEAVDMDGLAQTFAARDAAGRSFGALSTRGEANSRVHGATINVDYGVPSKRGREIFGALVPWGQVWRTGANRATHFTTDRDLEMGGLAVPAGEYTLYTIPEADGGTLMINTQTGQGGTTYNEDRDLGRVAMTLGTNPEIVEVFTILVEESGEGGVLKLQWDQTVFSVPFSVQ